MTKNELNLYECVECLLTCTKCKEKIGGFGTDDFSVAEQAHEEGWKVNQAGNVVCPNCSKKRKKWMRIYEKQHLTLPTR